MYQQPIVSFCIPTYNRADMTLELITNILTSDNPLIEVVVMDNCSSDNTVEVLQKIEDSRFRLYTHDTPVSPHVSWYDTMSCASGKWLFHLNDRDWIISEQIDTLVATLQILDTHNVGFAVAGEKLSQTENYVLFPENHDTICEFALRYSHPTGQIINKKEWDSIPNKEIFFTQADIYGDYPHGYLYAIMGNTKKGAYLLFDICDKAHYSQRVIKTTSGFYSNNSDRKEYFWPNNRFRLLTLACENLPLIEDSNLYPEFILQRYYEFFFCVTHEWHSICNNPTTKFRYHLPDLSTNYIEVMLNGFDYISLFREYLENNNYNWCNDNFYQQLCKIDTQLLNWLIPWADSLRQSET